MKTIDRKQQIRSSLCRSSQGISMTTMGIVAALELLMLVYAAVNSELFGGVVWTYRSLYLTLLAAAAAYMAVSLYVKKDAERRSGLMDIANPLCAALFYAWSLAVTYTDYVNTGDVDATVFMTFSLVVPLSFYMSPLIYGIIVAAADAAMAWLILKAFGFTMGPVINTGVFFIFQIVLGTHYLRMKMNAAERIVEERENALIDVLTGCPNRRAYEAELGSIAALPPGLAYIAADLNGLKEVNDRLGHEAGDRLIAGAARCIENCFGEKGQVFRIGGDEFAVLIHAGREELETALSAYEAAAEAWAGENGLPLSTSYGFACSDELPEGLSAMELARMADERMFRAKARYYRESGRDRRKYTPDGPETDSE